ncbi:MAG: hypothetical protein U1C70_04230 [Sediminibacterium sp.]|uniref:hypothetical protein n=1 Tax=Sediminibacterium sp. TaxID=1917865 RepID=UPI002AB9287D|nr:hypothetical protein [Sediminibacterium sp.]MDZ4071016.1 hypothetical protein [Sediminibacterium sp.]
MASVTITQLYTLLTQKLGKETAESLTSFIAEKVNEEVTASTKDIATKDFVKAEIAEAKSDTIKWMFLFWVSQLAAMFGFLYFFLKK